MSRKEKFAFYLPSELRAEVEKHYQEDGSHSLTAFIENAVRFYLGYLDVQDAGIFLPTAIRSCIDGRLGTMENRMAGAAVQAGGRKRHDHVDDGRGPPGKRRICP